MHCDYYSLCAVALSSRALFAFVYPAGSIGFFWLPAKLMSKCHPHATMIQISYFLSALVCLSVLTSPRRPRSSSSSVCCLKASNEIHTKQDGRRFCLLFFCSVSVCFSFIFPLAPFSRSLLSPSICPSHFFLSADSILWVLFFHCVRFYSLLLFAFCVPPLQLFLSIHVSAYLADSVHYQNGKCISALLFFQCPAAILKNVFTRDEVCVNAPVTHTHTVIGNTECSNEVIKSLEKQ